MELKNSSFFERVCKKSLWITLILLSLHINGSQRESAYLKYLAGAEQQIKSVYISPQNKINVDTILLKLKNDENNILLLDHTHALKTPQGVHLLTGLLPQLKGLGFGVIVLEIQEGYQPYIDEFLKNPDMSFTNFADKLISKYGVSKDFLL